MNPRFPFAGGASFPFLTKALFFSCATRGELSDRACAILGSSVDARACHGSFYPIYTQERVVLLLTAMRRVYFFYSRSRAALQRVTHRGLQLRLAELLLATDQDGTSLTRRPSSSSFKVSPSSSSFFRVYLHVHPPHGTKTPILPMLHKLNLMLKASPLNILSLSFHSILSLPLLAASTFS